jgi:hypothetical protein
VSIEKFIQMFRINVKRGNERLLYERSDTDFFDGSDKFLSVLNCDSKVGKERSIIDLLNYFVLDCLSLAQGGRLLLD